MTQKQFAYPGAIDPAEFASDVENPRRLYGLPAQIAFCTRCTYSNQKPNSDKEYKHTRASKKPTLVFDEEGVCSACRTADKKNDIDWEQREAALRALCDRYRSRNGSYDCVVPGSGGKDSFFASYKLKYDYGMNPLTVTWAPHIYTDWGWRNFQAWIHSGFDNYLFTPNGRVHRLLTRLALEQMFHPFQPFIMGQMYFPPRIAAKFGIPLVFYGENPTDYGNDSKGDDRAQKDWEYFSSGDRSEIFLAGTSLESLTKDFGLTEGDLDPYMPPNPEKLRATQVDVQYLGYYLRWHPQNNYYFSVENGGFEAAPERTAGTYSKYSSIDDKIDDLHYYCTFIKFGIGRATYDSSQEVRNGELVRDEAVDLVRRYDGEFSDRFLDENLRYLSMNEREFPVASKQFEQPVMDRDYFERLTDHFRSPHIWVLDGNQWRLRATVFGDRSGD